ncbi:MAG: flavin reductase family protein [Chloroflexi bacterium]|nr:flavin reductase family protein [Chloroflexota bacterium]
MEIDAFRTAMSQFATGVTVITTRDEQGEPHAMTANAFTSVCLDPPTVLVSVAHSTHTFGFLEKLGRFGVNILGQDQEELGAYFALRPEARKGGVEYSYADAADGLAALENSMVFMGCEVIGSHVYGDHTVYFAEVKEVRQNNHAVPPLMFFRSRWYNPAGE